MPADQPDVPRSRRELLDEVRRRATTRRRRRRARIGAAAAVAAAIAVAVTVPVVGFGGHGSSRIDVVSPSGPTSTAPTSTTMPPGRAAGPPRRTHHPAPSGTAPARTTTTPATTTPTTEPASLTVALPVVVCSTTIAVASPPPPVSLPSSIQVSVPTTSAGALAVYTDDQGTMKLLGPRGWACEASYGADGSGGVAVYPPGQAPPSNWGAGWTLPTGSSDSAIVGIETSACVGCTLGQACPLFSAAATAFQSNFGRPCPTARPTDEAVDQLGAGIVGFQDPGGVSGDGVPSGGANPANGVMTYHYPATSDGSWLDTCTLPPGQQSVCTTALDTFLGWYGQE